ncbi:MAG: bifunctional (p)ppGpp synthetase/guanosine-3',5'-bis(diphosphate) 3'-pyrophosphohydrolase, partial [Nitrospirae bacterium]|nr:bifunctional (p)ppGpp synthetase/guanosine-3',5'-bis(diphosphate) 3'-pyrophosphohydrolase [Nitrospirota bacterium]
MSMKPEEIEKKILTYNPEADVGLFRKAYDFIENAHKDQTRVSGEPYVVHPLEVASILASLRLDIITIVAGLLHDALEDTPTKLEQVKEVFGKEVSFLVDGLTKLSRIEFKTREEQQAESFRKMLLAMAKDIRIILIKLADRLHNMRTLEHLSPDKKTSIAQETRDIYAPIANRLGIGWMKIELEDLSLKYLHTSEYEDIVKKVAKREEERKDYINDVIDVIKNALKRENLPGDVRGRPKHYYGVYQKMLKQRISFEQVYDLTGIRIITETKAYCYAILGVIHSLWTPVPGRYKDFIGLPKPNGYQSLHTTVIGPKGERVEFQIRTHEMNSIAEEGIAAHWRYKEKVPIGESDMEKFGWLRQLIDLQQDLTEAKDFFDTIKVDLFPDVVYVFTPRGDVKELPRGSTP